MKPTSLVKGYLLILLLILATLPKSVRAEGATVDISGSLAEEKPLPSQEEIKKILIEKTQNDPEKSFLVKGNVKFVDLEREQERFGQDRDKVVLSKNLDQELQNRLNEMKELQNQLNKEVSKRVSVNDHLKQLVTLYESISADQATQIIKQLPTTLSVSILSMMNPKKSSKILAVMEPHLAADMSRRILKEPQRLQSGGKP